MPDRTPDPAQTPSPQHREPEREPQQGRLRSALVHPSRRQAVVAVLLAVLGFAFVVQVRDNAANDTYSGLREADLIQVLDGLTGTAERARREVDRLDARRDELLDESQARAAALDEAQQRVRTLNIVAGLVPVQGQGLRVTITESTNRVSVGALLDTVQELRTALTFSSGPVETLQTDDGATVQIEDLELVEITSVRESSRPEYAELVDGQ